jgi:beta-aspartyl-peptidase (threonine type)
VSAANQALLLLEKKTAGAAGLIIIDRQGRIGYARNTPCMPVCFITNEKGAQTDS